MVLAASLAGCTLVGAGLGGAVDAAKPGRYQARPVSAAPVIEPGTRVIAQLRGGRRLEGKYQGLRGPTAVDPERYVLVAADERTESAAVSEIARLDVDVGAGGWWRGAAVGAMVDGIVVLLAVTRPLDYDIELGKL